MRPPAVPLTEPERLCASRNDLGCRDPETALALLRHEGLELIGDSPPPGGWQGTRVFTLSAPHAGEPEFFRAKWRRLDGSGLFNVPRHELAAFYVQALFLDPIDQVVPPVVGRCLPLDDYRRVVDDHAQPSFEGVDCVFGVLTFWLQDVEDIEDAREDGWLVRSDEGTMLDLALFEESAVYRRSAANANLLAHLIRHSDPHVNQFLIPEPPYPPRLYLVDNSSAFRMPENPALWLKRDWSSIRVPGLHRRSVERLAELQEADFLGLLAFETHVAHGRGLRLVPHEDGGKLAMADATGGVSWHDGELRIGLKRAEVESLRRRVDQIIISVAAGEIRTFD